eukprot:TRINITY_DN29497_c0_g1_i1.p1 TRINITY_DN29497_c0_g1~~TRINITY_DN29497_c0_g1_i1.p1  ORF type:complete len:494 (-),score=118.35 TRINITY_DN29497_c0_g1_i1:58-1539(-)
MAVARGSGALLDALRSCGGLGFLCPEERLPCAAGSRGFAAAVAEPELWASLAFPSSSSLASLPVLSARYGRFVRQLSVAVPPGGALAVPDERSLAAALRRCGGLLRLKLSLRRGQDFAACVKGVVLPTLRELTLDHAPYFLLNSFSHQSGASGPVAATTSVELLAAALPALRELCCDYLLVGTASRAAEPLSALRELSVAALVSDDSVAAPWGSENCSRDLARVAAVAPGLQRLRWRDPKAHFGRMTLRPGQGPQATMRIFRRFCALPLEALQDACRVLPELERLEVATLQDWPGAQPAGALTDDDAFAVEDVGKLLGLDAVSPQNGAATDGCGNVAVAPTTLHLLLGGLSSASVSWWRASAERCNSGGGGNGMRSRRRLVLEFPSDEEASTTAGDRPRARSAPPALEGLPIQEGGERRTLSPRWAPFAEPPRENPLLLLLPSDGESDSSSGESPTSEDAPLRASLAVAAAADAAADEPGQGDAPPSVLELEG